MINTAIIEIVIWYIESPTDWKIINNINKDEIGIRKSDIQYVSGRVLPIFMFLNPFAAIETAYIKTFTITIPNTE